MNSYRKTILRSQPSDKSNTGLPYLLRYPFFKPDSDSGSHFRVLFPYCLTARPQFSHLFAPSSCFSVSILLRLFQFSAPRFHLLKKFLHTKPLTLSQYLFRRCLNRPHRSFVPNLLDLIHNFLPVFLMNRFIINHM